MKKKILCFFILILIFMMFFYNYSNGSRTTDLNEKIRIAEGAEKRTYRETALNNLKTKFNYNGTALGSNMKFDTYVFLQKNSDGTFNIAIGKPENFAGRVGVMKNLSKETVEKFGYNFDNPEQVYNYETGTYNFTDATDRVPIQYEKWPVVLIADFKDIDASQSDGGNFDIDMYIREVYGGTEEDYNYGKNEVNPQAMEYELQTDDWRNSLDSVTNFVKDFKHNKMGTIFNLILDGALPQIDTIQMIANSFQTIELKTIKDFKIVYKYNFLKTDGNEEYPGNTGEGAGNRNKFTNVSLGATNNGDESWQSIVNVDINNTDLISNSTSSNNTSSTNSNDSNNYTTYGFSRNTKIPVIVVDPYTMATGKVSAFDINFLKVDYNLHDPDASIWIKFRNIFALLTRITLYITAAILLTSLIWNGIAVMKKVTVEPKKRKKYMEGLINFTKACGMLVGVIIIMALSIYANEMFLPKVMTERKVELPNRVNVSEAGYSFSTTDTGYARYMAQMQNVDLTAAKFGYVVGYLLLAIRNLLTAIIMLLRTVIIFVLSIIGPLTVLFYAIGKPEVLPMDFRGWAKSYVAVASIQVLLAFTFSLTSAM